MVKCTIKYKNIDGEQVEFTLNDFRNETDTERGDTR